MNQGAAKKGPAYAPRHRWRPFAIVAESMAFLVAAFLCSWLFALASSDLGFESPGTARLIGCLGGAVALTIAFLAWRARSERARERGEAPRDDAARNWKDEGRVAVENRANLEALLAALPRGHPATVGVPGGETDIQIVGRLIEGTKFLREESASSAENRLSVKALIDSTPLLLELFDAHLSKTNSTTEAATLSIIQKLTEVKGAASRLVESLAGSKGMVAFLHGDSDDKLEKTRLLLAGLATYQKTLDMQIRSSIEIVLKQMNDLKSLASLIRNVTSMTNVLAINAAIEAARAGTVGRGFAVVASEVRKLSTQVEATAEQIDTIVTVVSRTVREKLTAISDLIHGNDETNLVADIALVLPRLSGDFHSAVEVLDSIVHSSHETVKSILSIIVEALGQAQFQDISRQQIEQVQKGLVLFGQKMEEIGKMLGDDWADASNIESSAEIANALQSSYTMLAQRKIHSETLGGPSVETEAAHPDIELF